MMMFRKPVILTCALAALVALGAGCGGSGGDDSLATSSLPKAEYVKQVNRICAAGKGKMVAEFSAYAKQHGVPDNLVEPKLAPGIVTVLVPAVQSQDEEIEEMGAPEGDEDEMEAFLAARRAVLARAEEHPPPTIFRFGTAFRKDPDQLAVKYGITECVYG